MKWIKTYWDDNFIKGEVPIKEFVLDISGANYTGKNAKACAIDLVHEIVKNYPPPYYLMVSGGVDSQALLQSWIKAEQPFIAYCAIFPNDLNYHDIRTLEEFRKIYPVNVKYLPFDIEKFFETELVDYATRYECNSPHIMAHAKISEMFTDGTVISGGMPLFRKNNSMQQCFNYSTYGLLRYAEISGRNFIPYFLCHTPEIVGAWQHSSSSLQVDFSDLRNRAQNIIAESEKQHTKLAQKSHAGLHSLGYKFKCDLYKLNDFDIIPQQNKLHGFEIINDRYEDKKHLIQDAIKKFPRRQEYRVFDVLYRFPLEDLVPYSHFSRLKVA